VETGQGQGSGQGMQQGVRVDADASWQEGSSGQKGDIGQGVRVDGRRVQQDTQPEYQFDLKIPKGSPLHQQSVDEAGLRALDKLFLIHIHRHNRIILPVTPETELLEGDILTFTGDLESVDALAERKNLERAVPVLDQNADHLPVFEAVVAPTSSLIGRTLKESLFRERFNAVVIGIQRQSDTLRGALGQIPIRPGDLLLIEGRKSFAQQWQRGNNEFYLVSERGDRMYPMTAQAPWVLTLIGAMLASVITGLLPMVTAALTTALVLVLIGVVRKRDIFGAVELPILLVIAASIGIGNAMESSGLATALAATVTGITTPLGLTATVIGIYLLTNLLTELITNNAAAVLMLPIALAAGLQTGLDPHTVAIIVAVAASASFLTPIGYQTNLMVMGAGRYKYTDYTKAGLPVTLILLGVTLAVVVLGG
jgi:di/tricarboxylate transporter